VLYTPGYGSGRVLRLSDLYPMRRQIPDTTTAAASLTGQTTGTSGSEFSGPGASDHTAAGENAARWATRFTSRADENFSVLSVLLPRTLRADFSAVYAFCRTADDMGDETGVGEAARHTSLALLADLRMRLTQAFAGQANDPLFAALLPVIRRHRLPIAPFDDLIRAFEQDQRITRYDTWEQLLDYCTRSADPVGRIVLMMCGYRPPEEAPANQRLYLLSDAICTALQLTNFWQDVRRDLLDRDRVYLPLREIGLDEHTLQAWLDAPPQSPVRNEYRRRLTPLVNATWGLFNTGRALHGLLRDDIAPVIRLFAAGGEQVLRKIEQSNYQTLWHRPRLSSIEKAGLILREMAGGDAVFGVRGGGR
jgi:squalene synthase HpnC